MEHIAIGTSGLRTSRIGLGTWAIGGWMWGGTDEAQSIATIRSAIERGVTLIDTAPGLRLRPLRGDRRQGAGRGRLARQGADRDQGWPGLEGRQGFPRFPACPHPPGDRGFVEAAAHRMSSTSIRSIGRTPIRRLRRRRGRWRTCAARARSGRSASATIRPNRWTFFAPRQSSTPCSRPTICSSARSRSMCCPMPRAPASRC